jgi:CBS domain containing-hemolysin-like protein
MYNDPIVVIFVSLLVSAFFSGIEIAYISANKLKIEVDKNKGEFTSKIYANLINKPSRFITTMLLGNNIALVTYGLSMGDVLTPYIAQIYNNDIFILLTQTILSTIFILIVAEFLPKVIFSQNSNGTLKLFAIPVFLAYYVLYPLVGFINLISRFIFKYLLRIKLEEEKLDYGLVDLDYFLKDISSGNLEAEELDNEIQILQNVLEFNSVKARECMVPRNEIVAVEIHDPMTELKQKFIDSGHSKLPVYRGTIDNIIGFVHTNDLFAKPKQVKHVLRPISVIPETIGADDIMSQFISKNRNLAVVVDEFGGTAGILTLEDVVEEIFGEIQDEHDKEQNIESQTDENEYIFSSRLEVDYLNEEYDLNLPKSDNYETLAGLIIDHVESIPEKGEIITIQNFEFHILAVSHNKINTVKLINFNRN